MRRSSTALASVLAMRVASHLRGGLTLSRALSHLAKDEGVLQPLASRLSERMMSGADPPTALAAEPGQEWRVLAVAWRIAHESGAPAAEALERMSHALGRLETIKRRRQVLLASPRSSMMLIMALPAVTVFVGELFGLRVIAQFTTPVGVWLLIIGVLVLMLGASWGWVMISKLARADRVGGFELDLMWIAMAGGTSHAHASRRVVDAAAVLGAEWVEFDAFLRDGQVEEVLRFAKQSGTPVRAMLLAESDAQRDASLTQIERAAEQLGVRILLPLGLCVLPSFLLIGVIPMIIAMLAVPAV